MNEPDNDIAQNILGETAKIHWKELQFFFAAGKAIYVDVGLDLVNVATEISNDNKTVVETWMKKKLVLPVPDEQAKMWVEENATVWAVVVKPWVLVQEIKT
jgi:hypothetical protein